MIHFCCYVVNIQYTSNLEFQTDQNQSFWANNVWFILVFNSCFDDGGTLMIDVGMHSTSKYGGVKIKAQTPTIPQKLWVAFNSSSLFLYLFINMILVLIRRWEDYCLLSFWGSKIFQQIYSDFPRFAFFFFFVIFFVAKKMTEKVGSRALESFLLIHIILAANCLAGFRLEKCALLGNNACWAHCYWTGKSL